MLTGASSGIGLAAAREFARRGARLALVGRDAARLAQAAEEVRATGAQASAYPCDFASLANVRELASTLREAYSRIDLLVNNAGGVIPTYGVTEDGFERTMQINHLSPFLLTNLLRDRVGGGRIINTASTAHSAGEIDPDNLNASPQQYRMFIVYGTTKQANIMFTAEAARRWPEIKSYCYHPGVVRSGFGRDSSVVSAFYKYAPFLRSPEKGADTMLWLAEQPAESLVDGAYYADRKIKQPTTATRNATTAAALWEASQKAVAL